MGSIGHSDSKLWAKQCMNGGLKTLGRTMFGVGSDNVQEFWTLSGRVGLCPVGGIWKCDFLIKSTLFFPSLILELYGTKLDET
jgi:hypothetical protein